MFDVDEYGAPVFKWLNSLKTFRPISNLSRPSGIKSNPFRRLKSPPKKPGPRNALRKPTLLEKPVTAAKLVVSKQRGPPESHCKHSRLPGKFLCVNAGSG